MTDPLRPFPFEQIEHEFLIANVTSVDGQTIRVGEGGQSSQVILLDANIVIIIHFVDDDNRVSAGEELLGHIGAYEACPARDQHLLEGRVGLHSVETTRG